MKLLLASPRGFCAGVAMAVECLDKALARFAPPIYVFHEIVHNRCLVDRYTARGVIFVNDLEAVPTGGTVLFSAHGVSPQVEREARQRQLLVIDATCPLVTKVHREAQRFAQKGYIIALLGHDQHDEVVGVIGEAPENIVLIESEDDIQRLDTADGSRLAYLTQTTLAVDDTRHLVQLLRTRFPEIQGPPTDDICYATQNRQEAVQALVGRAGMVLVIGSANSSNTQRLVDVARATGVPAKRIDRPEEIDLPWFDGVDTVVLSSGASVPEDLVLETIDWLRQRMPVELEEYSLRQENRYFPLPAVLRG